MLLRVNRQKIVEMKHVENERMFSRQKISGRGNLF